MTQVTHPSPPPWRKGELTADPFRLRESMVGLNQRLTKAADSKGFGYRFRINTEVPEEVRGDWGRLSQILAILGGSAVSFTEGGQVNMEVVLVDRTESEVTLCFSVYDTGPGMSDEQLAAVFETLSNGENSGPDNFRPTAPGLALASHEAALMDGYIFAQSREGEGTVFHLTVDLALD